MRNGKIKAGLRLITILAVVFAVCMSTGAFAKKIENVHPYWYSARMRHSVKVGKVIIPAGKTVTVANKGGSVSTIRYKEKRYKVPTSSFELTGLVTRGAKRYSIATAEAFVNGRGYSSSTGYLIWVSTFTQHLYVFKGKARHWTMIKHTGCATGRFEKETPLGISRITHKMPWLWFNQDVGQGGYYGLAIRGGFIHSWLFNIAWSQAHGGRKLMWNKEHYGKPVTSGCVRVRLDMAKWLYNKIPLNTIAVIY